MTSGPTPEDLAEFKRIREANIAKRNARLVKIMGKQAAFELFGIGDPTFITAPLPSATMENNPAEIQTLTNTLS